MEALGIRKAEGIEEIVKGYAILDSDEKRKEIVVEGNLARTINGQAVYVRDYEALEDIFREAGISREETYPKDRIRIEDGRVTKLNISSYGLKRLPDSIGNMKALEGLDVNDNQLTALPDSIGNMKALKWLDVQNNRLTALPDSIGNLKDLKELYVYNNSLNKETEGMLMKLKARGVAVIR